MLVKNTAYQTFGTLIKFETIPVANLINAITENVTTKF